MQLTVTDINADHFQSAALQQAVGEATSRLTDIQAAQTRHFNAGAFQRAFKLQATTGYVFGLGVVEHLDLGVVRNFVAVLGNFFPGNALVHAPLHGTRNQALSLRAGGGKAVFDEEKVSAHRVQIRVRARERAGRTQRTLRFRKRRRKNHKSILLRSLQNLCVFCVR